MPEYLAPGVFIEEVSYRSKSIEGVSTTTTGFVGPTRYGPVEIEPEVITNLTEFERIYGDGNQLNFGADDGMLHNYMWHGVRSFFEEGGKRLYISRTFRPTASIDNSGYHAPPNKLMDDHALPTNGRYETDGHARCWLTPQTAAMSAALRAIDALGNSVRTASQLAVAMAEVKNSALESQFDSNSVPKASIDTNADTQLVNAVLKLKNSLDDASAPDTVSKNLVITANALSTLNTAYANNTSANDLELFFENELKVAVQNTIVDSIDNLGAAIQIDALDQTSALSNQLANDVFNLVPVIKSEADAVITDEGAGSATEIAILAGRISKSCASSPDGEVLAKADDANTAAQELVGAVTDAQGDSTKIGDASNSAKDLVAKSADAANACKVIYELSIRLKNMAYVSNKSGNALQHINDLVNHISDLNNKSREALQAAMVGYYRRAWFAEQVGGYIQDLLTKYDELVLAAANTASNLDSHVPLASAQERVGGILLRARFPGYAGNISIRFNLSLGQNCLIPDSSSPGKGKLPGLVPGDFVWIGDKANSSGSLYLAYPNNDGTDWYFSTDNTSGSAVFWLNQATSSAAQLNADQNEVRVVSASVDVFKQNGTAQTWAGLSLQPNHRRAGGADSVSAKFVAEPASGSDARTLPFMMLLDDEVDLAQEVYTALYSRNATNSINLGDWPISATYQLSGGNDGKRPSADEYTGRGEGPDAAKTGLKAFNDVEDISIVAAPGAMFGYMSDSYMADAQSIVNSLINHAQMMKYRIAVLESGNDQSIGDIRGMRARYDSKHAALYYPWIRVLDPVTHEEIDLPPSGFVAGIYARNDIERAVYKAPANEVVRGAIGFEKLLNKAQQEVLNPEGINCFRFFEGRGYRLWGARTISSDPEWKYVNVRRYFAYLEHSIDRGTQWAVFEPNGEALWANVRETISDFLYNEWKNGALLGTDPKSAFFVRCDRSTMTQNDLDNGRLICKVGVAVLKPAEFVVFQIGQWTGDRKV